jgi:hypothetical protein
MIRFTIRDVLWLTARNLLQTGDGHELIATPQRSLAS